MKVGRLYAEGVGPVSPPRQPNGPGRRAVLRAAGPGRPPNVTPAVRRRQRRPPRAG
ncbi:MAG: hypothetical protein AVDCRST_MAG40-488 [uncultured Gemmatimonadaceae bacterium]|uniref:Uncharacterized protein n=1 Tax=uncultured Gemmatimonadaceae bacterium TaxID=246130 RepID=A0A6J4KFB8_9BACT|nr:MAG: hypothetical protein AVDCRST_MAG40-488 [uncultured Gemmatimonadaceae bacterium]